VPGDQVVPGDSLSEVHDVSLPGEAERSASTSLSPDSQRHAPNHNLTSHPLSL
jgi:hypothetical protein